MSKELCGLYTFITIGSRACDECSFVKECVIRSEFLRREHKEFIPAALDILAQLREALGWKEGSLKDVLEVLCAARKSTRNFEKYNGWILANDKQEFIGDFIKLTKLMQKSTNLEENVNHARNKV